MPKMQRHIIYAFQLLKINNEEFQYYDHQGNWYFTRPNYSTKLLFRVKYSSSIECKLN